MAATEWRQRRSRRGRACPSRPCSRPATCARSTARDARHERVAVSDMSFTLQRGARSGSSASPGRAKRRLHGWSSASRPRARDRCSSGASRCRVAPATRSASVVRAASSSSSKTPTSRSTRAKRSEPHSRRRCACTSTSTSPSDGARVARLLDSVGLDPGVGSRRPRNLSGGQRQRVAIARALACEPTTLVLDEAVSALDISVQAQVLNLLNRLRRETDTALVFISHDLAAVAQVTDYIYVMHRGAIVEHGATHDVLSQPRSPADTDADRIHSARGWRPRHARAESSRSTTPGASSTRRRRDARGAERLFDLMAACAATPVHVKGGQRDV